MRRLPVHLECGVISIDLDEEEQGRILNLLVNIEFVAARLAFEACASVKNETLAKLFDSVSTNPEVSGVKERHVVHCARRGASA
jgi:hypothetical protein